jgi:very-short-patch-repair endonuclease
MDGPASTKAFAKTLRRDLSLPEVMLWQRLRGRRLEGFYFRRQHPVGPYVLDFYCDAAKLAVEVDGAHHTEGDRPERDAARDAWCATRGIETLRFTGVEMLSDPAGCVDTILAALRRRTVGKSIRRPARRRD